MKKYLLIVLLLSGCTTVPVKQTMPNLPEEFPNSCQQLKLLEGNTVTLSKLMETVATNYNRYHECALYYKNLTEWYNMQKEIFNKK